MVLDVAQFRLHTSLRKTLQKFRKAPASEIRIDSAFEQVIVACSSSVRAGQSGTWIVPDMVSAYCELHRVGLAHSVETWVNGKLAGGLYCVAIGRSVFGESMFSRSPDASKIALAALICFCRRHAIAQIDCQQNTRHLASLGAREIPRACFMKHVATGLSATPPSWQFDTIYWQELLPSMPATT